MTTNKNREEALLAIVKNLSEELYPNKKSSSPISLDSSLERDLGFDSLGQAELLSRVEQAFQVRLPEQILSRVETSIDLLRAIGRGSAIGQTPRPTEVRSIPLDEVHETPESAKTLGEVLEWHVRSHPNRTHIYLYGENEKEEKITYADLRHGAEAVAAGLRERNLQAGQAVAIMLPTSRDYFYSFFGILLAGGIPLPLYPPVRLSQIEDHLRRHAAILNNALVTTLITFPEAQSIARLLKSHVETLHSMITVQELSVTCEDYAGPVMQPENIAFLQYTSGSTGTPKGVVLTHANLLANIRAMGQAVEADSTDIFVSWLPLYHDMGLIGAWLGSLYYAGQLVLMSPLSFLTRPQRWLWAIHRHQGTLSAAPNFAYELCLHKIDDRDIEGLDLSSWRMALNGAEPVSPKTILNFQERFAKYGLRESTMAPVYGLAESTVGLAFSPLHRGTKIDRIKRDLFVRTRHALPAEMDDPNALSFVSSGVPLPGHEIRIVNPGGREVGDREEGHLEFKGPSSTCGYFRNPEATERLFHGEWLDSGDLAYMAKGNVYITGRSKDIIIRAGQNIYPHELEETVGNIPGVRKGCVAVFGSRDRKTGTERIVVLAETRETQEKTLEKLRSQIENVTVDLLGMPADEVVLAPHHTVLKTSSGKVRRSASRDLYESGAISKGPRAVWRQFARLLWSGLLPQIYRSSRAASDYLYAAYAWALFSLLAPIAWTAVVLLPKFSWRYSILRKLARTLVFLSGTMLRVKGKEHLQSLEHCVLVANHASYLDSPILIAALPGNFSYVAKRELTTRFISRTFLRQIRTEFVERFDKQRGMVDARKTSKAVQEGRSLIFFPEGTFYRMPGLHPFHMGAFAAAAEAGVPVIPVAISGSRSILRSGQMFPRRGSVTVTISAPITPEGNDWASAIKLRDAVRAEILKHCGEPDLTS